MTARSPDTSVVVAGLCSWHPDHDKARPVLAAAACAIAHVITESYSVLTRLPHGQRIDSKVAWKSLSSAFPRDPMVLGPDVYDSLFSRLATAGVSGGAVYDALVAETARTNDVELVSFDRRAARTYEIVGVEFVFLES